MFASRPLRSTVVTRFAATMGRSDSRTEPPQGYAFPSDVGLQSRPPRRVSQVPRLICPHAPSPTTPESPVIARSHCFTTGGRLHHVVQLGRSQLYITRPNRFACATARGFAFARLRPVNYSTARWLGYLLNG